MSNKVLWVNLVIFLLIVKLLLYMYVELPYEIWRKNIYVLVWKNLKYIIH